MWHTLTARWLLSSNAACHPPTHLPPPQADQEVTLVAVGPDYKTWQGGVDEATGAACIGVSYEKLCQSVKPGNIIKVRAAAGAGAVGVWTEARVLRCVCRSRPSAGCCAQVSPHLSHPPTPPLTRRQVADGTLSIRVEEVLSERELRGRCLNAKSLGETKNVNLPGVHVDTMVLTDKDVDDVGRQGEGGWGVDQEGLAR